MFERWRAKRRNREIVERVYETLVARARRPALYLEGGLPDTVMGRYEALGIEMLLFLDRCRGTPELGPLAQDLVDRFMLDMDHSLREIGIGYQSVPKRMRKLAARFYTRVADYRTPLDDRDERKLADALVHRAFAGESAFAPAAAFLAAQMIAAADAYARLSPDELLSGSIAIQPEPFHAG